MFWHDGRRIRDAAEPVRERDHHAGNAPSDSGGRRHQLAARFGPSRDTIRKWRRRASTADRSHTPHRLAKTLNDGQEALVLYPRTTLRLPLDDLEAALKRYVWLYNHHLPQKAIRHRTPIQTLKDRQAHKPGIFKKAVRKHPGLDT